MSHVLIVDDEESICWGLERLLTETGHEVSVAASAEAAFDTFAQRQPDLIVLDVRLPGMDGLTAMQHFNQLASPVPIVVITAFGNLDVAVSAMQNGAVEYLPKPFDLEQAAGVIDRALAHRRRPAAARPCDSAVADQEILGSSAAMQEVFKRIALVAPTDASVLITGESGTGKELVARTVHALGSRREKPFIGLNCPALSAHLMESELFGHERGAFTGAEARRAGRFEAAQNGSILLDEVTELDLPLQAKLLRVLQERSFERVGSSETVQVDVRVLATTNRDLRKAVSEGRFREDLYYRLAVIPLAVPPLRERIGDVPELLDHFLREAADRVGCEPAKLSGGAIDMLVGYRWPGNVRELQNLMTRAVVLAGGAPLTAEDLRPWLIASDEAPTETTAMSQAIEVGLSLHEMERRLIEATLDRFGGHRARTAEALGIGLRTLTAKIKEYGYTNPTDRTARAA